MTSAGNDIVSLAVIDVTRTKNPAFYSKIINDPENTMFAGLESNALPFEHFVWMLWSVKEAAFKYFRRTTPALVFTPVKFVVQQLKSPLNYTPVAVDAEQITGKGFNQIVVWDSQVSVGDHTLHSKTFISAEFISSVVNHSENFDNIYWGIKRVKSTDNEFQSAAVREFALASLENATGSTGLLIGKNEHVIPVVLKGNEELGVGISLSHHDNWLGYSFAYSA